MTLIRPHPYPSAHPTLFSNLDGLAEKPKGRIVPIVIAGKQIDSLADANAIPEPHGCVVVDPHQLAEPDVIANLQKPGVFDGNARLADEALADLGAETAEDSCLPARRDEGQHRALEEPSVDQIPSGAPRRATIAGDDGLLVQREIVAGDFAPLDALGREHARQIRLMLVGCSVRPRIASAHRFPIGSALAILPSLPATSLKRITGSESPSLAHHHAATRLGSAVAGALASAGASTSAQAAKAWVGL